MKNLGLILVWLSLVSITASAQSKPSYVGTWKLDPSQSDFGSDPAPRSTTITVFKDTPERLSWRVDGVDTNGKTIAYSWIGPEDGSMQPVMQNGKAISKQSAKKEEDGALLRHDQDPDGSSSDARSTLSADGNTMTDEITMKSKDGKETKETYVSHRVRGAHKITNTKPGL